MSTTREPVQCSMSSLLAAHRRSLAQQPLADLQRIAFLAQGWFDAQAHGIGSNPWEDFLTLDAERAIDEIMGWDPLLGERGLLAFLHYLGRCPDCGQYMTCGDELIEERCCDACAGYHAWRQTVLGLLIGRGHSAERAAAVLAYNDRTLVPSPRDLFDAGEPADLFVANVDGGAEDGGAA